ncbi:MAG: phage holin family protein [Minisyncoccales bacterium]|jgi:putative membrane protein
MLTLSRLPAKISLIMGSLIAHIIVGVIGIWLATGIPGVVFLGDLSQIALAGLALGVINFAIKPILDILTFPLKVVTFGLFSLLLNMAIIWSVDVLVLGKIFSLSSLFITTVIIWILNLILIKKN